MMRATMSVPPPGAKPTTTRMVLAGYCWAEAGAAHSTTSPASRYGSFMISSSFLRRRASRAWQRIFCHADGGRPLLLFYVGVAHDARPFLLFCGEVLRKLLGSGGRGVQSLLS